MANNNTLLRAAALLLLVAGAAAAASASLSLRPLAVRQQQPPACAASQEYLTCVSSCDLKQRTCTKKTVGVCTAYSVACTNPNCCATIGVSGGNLTSTVCSKSCCVGVNQNGKQDTPTSCMVGGNTTGNGTAAGNSTGNGTAGGKSGSNSSTTSSSNSSTCFPAHATVELQSGLRLRMDELRVGHRVRVANDAFSDVFLFTHKLQRATAPFLLIRTASGHSVSMTSGHYVYANGASLIPAASIQVGDDLTLASGARSAVVSVSEAVHTGVYNPQTLHGDIVVDGIVASTYTTAVSPVLGHASLSPLRALYSALGVTTSLLDGGADYAVRLLPRGIHSY
jgi:hypothetical protein